MTVHLSLSVSISHQQKLLVGDFPHELEADDMDEDVPKRKNRTKARVRKRDISVFSTVNYLLVNVEEQNQEKTNDLV